MDYLDIDLFYTNRIYVLVHRYFLVKELVHPFHQLRLV